MTSISRLIGSSQNGINRWLEGNKDKETDVLSADFKYGTIARLPYVGERDEYGDYATRDLFSHFVMKKKIFLMGQVSGLG